jgi:hypothetical protein
MEEASIRVIRRIEQIRGRIFAFARSAFPVSGGTAAGARALFAGDGYFGEVFSPDIPFYRIRFPEKWNRTQDQSGRCPVTLPQLTLPIKCISLFSFRPSFGHPSARSHSKTDPICPSCFPFPDPLKIQSLPAIAILASGLLPSRVRRNSCAIGYFLSLLPCLQLC